MNESTLDKKTLQTERNRIKAEVERLPEYYPDIPGVPESYKKKVLNGMVRKADVLKIVSIPNTTDSELKEDLVNLTEDEVRHECYRLGLGVVGNPDVFDWMQRWLKAYDTEHNTNLAEEVIDWVNEQPMGC